MFELFEGLRPDFAELAFIFVENGSMDATRDMLVAWCSKSEKRVLLTPPLDVEALSRTERIAYCRNLTLDYAREKLSDFDLYITVDMDLRIGCLRPGAIAAAAKHLSEHSDLSGVSANSLPVYYDIWALRHPNWCPNDCWEDVAREKDTLPFPATSVFVYSRQVRIDPESPPFQVRSAFNGLAIYRLKDALLSSYVGVRDGKEVCEHVAFNVGLPAALHIVPFLTVDAPLEHLSPSFSSPRDRPTVARGPFATLVRPIRALLQKLGGARRKPC